ncbi:MAG: IS30 family transposase [Lawsonibacter sp.]|jgi:hypothetical protein|nr:IS30 family transposase [Lawsonibacter sp.]
MSDATENTIAPDSPALSGPVRDTFSRKWQLTFNNPKEHGWTHEKIREVLDTFPTLCYWCMADEIGGEQQTYHTHLFLNLAPSKCRFSTLKSKFPGAHIEKAFGTSRENRDYIMKDGKWKDSEKGTTSVEGTFEEFGECPEETPGKSKETERILEMLKDGADKGKCESVLVLTERLTRYEIILRVLSKTAQATVEALRQTLTQFPKGTFQTITVDNGSEFSDCEGMEQDVDGNKRLTVYYCHPYSSCERGSNERNNRIIRRFFHKGHSLRNITQTDCDFVADKINNMPRKILDYSTAQELFNQELSKLTA